jgi:hypothetical protein
MHWGQGVEEFAANISKMAILWLRCAYFRTAGTSYGYGFRCRRPWLPPEKLRALKALKKAGIIGVFVGDSGFLCGEICNLIEESGHQFIFAQAQHKQVKQRGKNAKNKRTAATQS